MHERITGRLNKNGYAVDSHKGDKKIFDTSKVDSHSAITPTINLMFTKENLQEKMGNQHIDALWNTYKTIFDRYCAVFCSEQRKVAKTIVEIEVGNQAKEIIKLRGEVEKDKGWAQFEKAPSSNPLPNFKEGDAFSVNFIPVKSTTKPPKHYTVTTLNNKLKNPLKQQSNTDNEEEEIVEEEITDEDIKNLKSGITIGTEASKPTIIKTALDNEIIAMGSNKKDYLITPKGIALIELLEKNGVVIDVNTTVKIQVQIQQVFDDKLSVQDLLEMNKEQLDKWIDKEAVANLPEEGVKYNKEEPLGKCLCCGNEITALKTKTGDKFYKCQNKDCKFVLFEKDKFFERFGKTITLSNVKSLLKYKKCKVTGLINKANKKYDAYFCIDSINDGRPQWKLEFINDYKKKE